jgi:hypothetical protein
MDPAETRKVMQAVVTPNLVITVMEVVDVSSFEPTTILVFLMVSVRRKPGPRIHWSTEKLYVQPPPPFLILFI